MISNNLKIALFFFLVLALPMVALAHQPRLVSGQLIEVANPEISQAFYGQLSGSPHLYKINSAKDFTLYLNILVPKIPNIKKDISAKIFKGDDLIGELIGPDSQWQEFYEPFGGDYYYQGPEFKEEVQAGEYRIEVFNPTNKGKYSLAVGQIESFPPGEIIKTIWLLPQLKKDFFEKSPLTAYFNYSGLFLLAFLIITFIIILLLIKIIKKFACSRPRPEKNNRKLNH